MFCGSMCVSTGFGARCLGVRAIGRLDGGRSRIGGSAGEVSQGVFLVQCFDTCPIGWRVACSMGRFCGVFECVFDGVFGALSGVGAK